MEFLDLLQNYRKKIDNSLENYFAELLKQTKDEQNKKYIKIMQEFTMRKGKRLRPILVIIGYNSFQKENDDILKVAITAELLESFFLIHDDIIDKSDLRRGKPTVHKYFEQFYDKEFSQSLAILLGDTLLNYALLPIMQSNFSAEIKLRLLQKVNEIMQQTNFGQIHELMLVQKDITQVDEETILSIYREKTARYTIEGPLQLGAIAADATESDLSKISNIALPLGIAFQLQDDILGLFGSVEKIGKPIDSDIKEGKKTLLMLKALEGCSLAKRKYLISKLGSEKITIKDMKRIKQIVIDSESLTCSQQLIHGLLQQSKQQLQSSSLNGDGKKFISDLADYIAAREY